MGYLRINRTDQNVHCINGVLFTLLTQGSRSIAQELSESSVEFRDVLVTRIRGVRKYEACLERLNMAYHLGNLIAGRGESMGRGFILIWTDGRGNRLIWDSQEIRCSTTVFKLPLRVVLPQKGRGTGECIPNNCDESLIALNSAGDGLPGSVSAYLQKSFLHALSRESGATNNIKHGE